MPNTDTPKALILIVDDEKEHAQVMCEALARLGHRCDVAYALSEARELLARKPYDVVVTDLVMEGRRDGLELLETARGRIPPPPVVLVTAHGDIPTAVEAMNRGANSFIEKPLDLEHFRAQVTRAVERASLQKHNQALQEQILEGSGFEGVIGKSGGMQHVLQTARQVAASDLPVLIMGESGTGKELIARAIHHNSRRRRHRLVALNCAGLSESILEDELFGHVRGAFTGADSNKKGLIDVADNGTIFLDEIGEMSPGMQVKLLRVLQDRRYRRVGGTEEISASIRVIAATNRDLAARVAEGQFREDLYYRLNVIPIRLPALRERADDVPLIAEHFLAKFTKEMGKTIVGFSADALERLKTYGWPGNVRELENVVERAVALESADRIQAETLGDHLSSARSSPAARASVAVPSAGFNLEHHLQEVERTYVERALRQSGGIQTKAAELLGLSFRQFRYLVKKYNLKS
jgi:two-component system response regulator PilR (NtrC family)